MAPHSSVLTWRIPWMEEPGRLQSMGSLRVGQDWATSLSFALACIGEGRGNPLQCSCLENPRDGAAWWAAVYGVEQSWTRLRWLSSSSIVYYVYSSFCMKHCFNTLWHNVFHWSQSTDKTYRVLFQMSNQVWRLTHKFTLFCFQCFYH